MPKVNPIPPGYRTLTPSLVVRDGARAMEFYKRAFGAEEVVRMPGPGGKIMHAEMRIGDCLFMLSDEMEGGTTRAPQSFGGTTVTMCIYSNDVDAAWKKATAAGAKVSMPLENQFWGDRFGKVTDPFGHDWALMQHVEDVSPQEMERRGAEWMKSMGGGN